MLNFNPRAPWQFRAVLACALLLTGTAAAPAASEFSVYDVELAPMRFGVLGLQVETSAVRLDVGLGSDDSADDFDIGLTAGEGTLLDLSIGPVDTTLFGFDVLLDDGDGGPVRVVVSFGG